MEQNQGYKCKSLLSVLTNFTRKTVVWSPIRKSDLIPDLATQSFFGHNMTLPSASLCLLCSVKLISSELATVLVLKKQAAKTQYIAD